MALITTLANQMVSNSLLSTELKGEPNWADRLLKLIFGDRSLCILCHKTRKTFKKLSDIVITKLFLFLYTFLCEQDISVIKYIKTKN